MDLEEPADEETLYRAPPHLLLPEDESDLDSEEGSDGGEEERVRDEDSDGEDEDQDVDIFDWDTFNAPTHGLPEWDQLGESFEAEAATDKHDGQGLPKNSPRLSHDPAIA
ncbi:hypothetical protein DFH06DRAFT_1126846 [Mycena polygramma]|nr:hypothetical protein DFH06DRAFT_1126846 [Mycena polygramma]